MTDRIPIAQLREDLEEAIIAINRACGEFCIPGDGCDCDQRMRRCTDGLNALIADLQEAHEAKQLVVEAFMATPVRDETRDAHFALELARQKLNRSTNRFDFEGA
jgi:hypothetical protein